MPNSIIEMQTAYAFTGDRVIDATDFLSGALELITAAVAQ